MAASSSRLSRNRPAASTVPSVSATTRPSTSTSASIIPSTSATTIPSTITSATTRPSTSTSASTRPSTSTSASTRPSTSNSTSTRQETEEDEDDSGLAPTPSQIHAQNRDLKLSHFLTLPGITESDLETLRKSGYATVRSVSEVAPHVLERVGLTTAKIHKIQTEAMAMFPLEFETVSELHRRRKNMVKISTGSSQLDAALEGGIDTETITGIFGESRAGKSQFCMTLAVMCQKLVTEGGAEGQCIYIDTVGGFRPERIAEIAAANRMDVETVKRNIIYMRVKSTNQLFSAFIYTKLYMTKERTALIVIDSGTAPFKEEYPGRGDLQPRQARINAMIGVLQQCVSQSSVAVVLTAQAYDSPDPYKPQKNIVGGNTIQHGCHAILQIRSGSKEAKIVTTYKYSNLPVKDTKVQIGPRGIEDYIEQNPRRQQTESE